MKNILILFLFLFVLTSITSAQLISNYGLKTGVVVSQQEWNYSINLNLEPDARTSFNACIFAEFFDTRNFNLVAELNYVQKGIHKILPIGTIENPDGNGETVDWKLNLNYINLSALAKGKYDFGVITPYILFGPKLDIEVSNSESHNNDSFYNNFEKSRFGFKAGAGSEFKIGSVKFLTEIVYDMELNLLFKNENIEINSNSYILNFGIYL